MHLRSPSARPRLRRYLVVVALLAAACAADRPERQVVDRLVDPSFRAGAAASPLELVTAEPVTLAPPSTAGLPTATLDAGPSATDTRPVLATHRRALLAYLLPVPVDTDDVLTVTLELEPTWPSVSGVVLAVHARIGSTWQRLPATWAPVTIEPGRRRVHATLRAPGVRAGSTVEVAAEAYLAPEQGRTSYRTPPLDIPPAAVLELATGVLPPASDQGPVRFSVAACEGDDCTDLFTSDVDDRDGAGWREARIALAPIAGRRRALRFETRHLAEGPGRFTLPVWADPVISAPAPAAPAAPNIVLVSIDTLRADHLGTYGYSRGTSPFLDAFAARGVVFENLIAEAASTDPSHMTMFTSLPAAVHGATSGMKPLAVPAITLAEALRGHGYRTAAFTEDGPLAHDRGFARGFEVYGENASADLVSPDGRVTRTFEQARAWLEARPATPFFLFLHTFQVHAPYSPPLWYRLHFLADGDDWVAVPTAHAARHRAAEDDARNYDREIRFVDDELERLLGWMQRTGLLARSVVVLLSDHGEEFYEHGALGHGTLPYEQVLRPPLVVVGPGVPGGRRVAELVAHLDLMPTILDLAGAPHPPALQGRSVAPLVLGRSPADGERDVRPVFSASWVLPEEIATPASAVRIGTRKLIRYVTAGTERFEYYDLARDPGERHDLWPEHAAEAADLRALLDRREDDLAQLRRRLTSGGPAVEPAPVPLDPQREEKLRSLGYIH